VYDRLRPEFEQVSKKKVPTPRTLEPLAINRATLYIPFLSKISEMDYSSKAKGSNVHYFALTIGTVDRGGEFFLKRLLIYCTYGMR
jgi:hypothetical protein